jgi:predicted nucleic-acid-binding Zn-ribbon protein
MGFIKNFKKGYEGIARSEFELCGAKITCSHCGSSFFEQSEAQLNTAGLTFLGLDWANKTATTLICSSCGKLEWFLSRPEELQ